MALWLELARCLAFLYPACSRGISFSWLSTVILGLCSRRDLAGVTSLVRASALSPAVYRRLLHVFHSSAVQLERLTKLWLDLVLLLFTPLTIDGRLVCIADGIHVGKEGRKMPGVKSLYNDSPDNTKPPFIMGHAFHALSLLVQTGTKRILAIPLTSRITAGLLWPDEPVESLPTRLAALVCQLWAPLQKKIILVTDSFYAGKTCIEPLRKQGHHMVTRVRITTAGYRLPPRPRKSRRGRPRFFGKHLALRNLFKQRQCFTRQTMEIYGKQAQVEFRQLDLIWKPLHDTVRFVLVRHPYDQAIFMTTDLTLSGQQVIELYSYRFKIESGFKQAIHTLGSYRYHFWMMDMEPIKRGSGDQNLAHHSNSYRAAVARKLGAYHRFTQAACIAQGLLLHLSVNHTEQVWGSFRSWLRTIRPGVLPSEAVVAESLRWTFFGIFTTSVQLPAPLEFLREHTDRNQLPDWLKLSA